MITVTPSNRGRSYMTKNCLIPVVSGFFSNQSIAPIFNTQSVSATFQTACPFGEFSFVGVNSDSGKAPKA